VITEGEYNILCIGGATSIDRYIQKANGTYYINEVLKYNAKVKTITNIDIVVAHIAPNFAYPQIMAQVVLEYAKNDYTLLDELQKERRLMAQIYNDIKTNNPEFKKFIYGHFHKYHNENIDGVDFICLESNQLFEVYPKI
jgi:hypothetical protein